MITRHLSVTPAVDLARVSKGAEDTACILIGDGQCLHRHEVESMVGASLTVALQFGGRVSPYVDAGRAFVRSLAPENPGERRQYSTPQLEGGVRVSSPIGRWSLAVRWRRVDRWEPRDRAGELALLAGFMPGRSR